MDFEVIYNRHTETALHGRYITLREIEPLLQKLNTSNQLSQIGNSVLGKPLYSYQIGKGNIRILIWSQMHGNESTTTKALFDLLNFLNSATIAANELLHKFTFYCLPMVNPDGAELYSRENASGIDLNRDACNLSQPESIALREAFNTFHPNYCYNLHDQRTIFGVDDSGKPATVSFLAPAYNEERATNETRLKAIHVIAGMNKELQRYIPGQVGRFDDAFNINCVGDTFQFLNVPTILFEAGHFAKDYQREQTRKYLFIALLASLKSLNENVIVGNENAEYLNIPQNKVSFYDFVYKNVKINYDSYKIITNFAIQYREELIAGKICFNAYFSQIGNLEDYFGHFEYDADGAGYSDDGNNIPELGKKANFYLDNAIEVVNGMINS
jgi:hypothetical protein